MYEYQKLPEPKVIWPRGSMHTAFLAAAAVVTTVSLVAAAQMLRPANIAPGPSAQAPSAASTLTAAGPAGRKSF